MKNFSILILLLFIPGGEIFSQSKEYYVTVKNDTIPLGPKDYIDIHSHPQLLRVKDKEGNKKVILPDSVVYLQQDRSYLSGKLKSITVMDKFTLMNVKMNNGRNCRHYMREVYRLGNVAIMESPFCSDCHTLELYLTENGKFIATITRDNFKGYVQKYFQACPQMVQYSEEKKYYAAKFHRFITKKLSCNP